MLNKPRGYVTTLADPEKRPTVMELMAKQKQGPHGDHVRLYPVGRLDYLSEGLLLMTNDGDLANGSPRLPPVLKNLSGEGLPEFRPRGIDQLRRGIMIDRGRLNEVRSGRRDRVITSPAKIEQVRGGDNPWFELTLTEGRNRQIRKMFEEIGHHVEKIRRIGYGALRLDVPPGDFRELTPGEVTALGRAARGQKVVPKQKTPEFAQLKSLRRREPRRRHVWLRRHPGLEVQSSRSQAIAGLLDGDLDVTDSGYRSGPAEDDLFSAFSVPIGTTSR